MLLTFLILSGVFTPVYATYLIRKTRRQRKEIEKLNKLILEYEKIKQRRNH